MKKALLLLMVVCGSFSVANAQGFDTNAAVIAFLKAMGMNVTEDDEQRLYQTRFLLNSLTGRESSTDASREQYKVNEVFHAPVDGAYYGKGDSRNDAYYPTGMPTDLQQKALRAGGKLKRSGTYAWSLVEQNGKIYFGTNTNYLCSAWSSISEGVLKKFPNAFDENLLQNILNTDCWVCELKERQFYGQTFVNDIMPPRTYVYNPKTGIVKDITPEGDVESAQTEGFRSAGAKDGVVLFAGPDRAFGSTVFAYDAETDEFLGSGHFSKGVITNAPDLWISNVRRWQVIGDALYVGGTVSVPGEVSGASDKGALLRWVGNKKDPLKFELVGYSTGSIAEICEHDGRIYGGTWTTPSTVIRSQKLPEGGFTKDKMAEFETVWSLDEYDPEYRTTSQSIAGFVSYKGKLYWGMFGLPYFTIFSAPSIYQAKTDVQKLNAILGSYRVSPLFCATDFANGKGDWELLFGEDRLPTYNWSGGNWYMKPTGKTPKWGNSGCNNLYGNYIWAAKEYNDRLYLGTMDFSDLIDPVYNNLLKSGNQLALRALHYLLDQQDRNHEDGFEMLCIDNHNSPKWVTSNGFGNKYAYGIRNFLSYDGHLYVGTANPFTLAETGGFQILDVQDAESATAIHGTQAQPMQLLYNPVPGVVSFSTYNGEKITNVNIYDTDGKLISQSNEVGENVKIQTDGVRKPVIAEVKAGGKTYSLKFIMK